MKKIFLMVVLLSYSLGFADTTLHTSNSTFYTVLKEVKEIMNYVLTDTSITAKEKTKFWNLIQKKIELMEDILNERAVNNNNSNGPTASVLCAKCQASGANENCSTCGGDGYVWTPDQAGNEKPCASCKGTGFIGNRPCKGCTGSGWANATPNPPKTIKEHKKIFGN